MFTARFGTLVALLVAALGCSGCQKADGRSATPIGPADAASFPAGGGRPVPAAEPVARDQAKGAGDRFESAPEGGDFDDALATEESERQGLGTEYGEQRFSRTFETPFERGSQTPDALLALWYNDVQGVREMASRRGGRGNLDARISTPEGLFAMSVIDELGRPLSALDVSGRRYVVGQVGQRYQIGVENHSASRLEVVASVDGLDVIDGQEAGFHKRGYVLDPFTSVVIDGWRTSEDTVAAFRFSSMEDSYADRRGMARNVGVVGVALFHERGHAPLGDLDRRHSADPFPSRFAPRPR